MKKWISVALTICLLVLGMNLAVAEKAIYNNGEAPELIRVADAQGVYNVAVIKDAQGNVIAAIPDNGLLKITYAGDRDEEAPEIEELLTVSLETLIKDAHVADAAWLVETDLFYVEIPEDYAGYLTDGAVAEMVFKPLIMKSVSELLVLTTEDGITWTEAPSVSFNGDGTVTVGVDRNCVVAFVITYGDFAQAYDVENIVTYLNTGDGINEEENPNFTPSVSGKPDPALVLTLVDDDTCVAVVTDENGDALELINDWNAIVVTPLSERDYNPDVVTYEHLQWAYDTICAAPDLGGLADENGENALVDEIERRLEGTGLVCADVTVSDLFEVTVYGDYLQMLRDGNRIEVTLDRNFRQDKVLMVLYATDIDQWHVMDDQYVTINADGTVTLSMDDHGVFAFVVERLAGDITTAAEGVVTAP